MHSPTLRRFRYGCVKDYCDRPINFPRYRRDLLRAKMSPAEMLALRMTHLARQRIVVFL